MGWFDWFTKSDNTEKDKQQSAPEHNLSLWGLVHMSIGAIGSTTTAQYDLAKNSIVINFFYNVSDGTKAPKVYATPLVPLSLLTPPQPWCEKNDDGIYTLVDYDGNWKYTTFGEEGEERPFFIHDLFVIEKQTTTRRSGELIYIPTNYFNYINVVDGVATPETYKLLDVKDIGLLEYTQEALANNLCGVIRDMHQLMHRYHIAATSINSIVEKAKQCLLELPEVARKTHPDRMLPKMVNASVLEFNGVQFIKDQITGWRYNDAKRSNEHSSVDIFVLGKAERVNITNAGCGALGDHIQVLFDAHETISKNSQRWVSGVLPKIVDEYDPGTYNPYVPTIFDDNKDLLSLWGIDQAISDAIEQCYQHEYQLSYLEVLKNTFDELLPNINRKQ